MAKGSSGAEAQTLTELNRSTCNAYYFPVPLYYHHRQQVTNNTFSHKIVLTFLSFLGEKHDFLNISSPADS